MNDQQIRLECLKLAIGTPGDPNILANAWRYVGFVCGDAKQAVEAPNRPAKGPRRP